MHILITGGTGFIGSALIERLLQHGHRVTVLSRQGRDNSGDVRYIRSLDSLGDHDEIVGIVNLAGASLGTRRWTRNYKRQLLSSRLATTAALLQLIGRLSRKPAVLVSASAIGYYGHHGDEALAEDGEVVPGFAQDLCQQWEQLAMKAEQQGVRVCLARLGVVLDRDGGAMQQMARPFQFGVANWLGDGRQWLSWVHRQDVVAALMLLLERDDLSGPFNITAPEAVTARGFCEAMKRRRRTIVTAPLPAPVARLLLGEMADEILLNGQRVVPARLLQAGFEFEFPDLDSALAAISAA